MQYLIQIYNTGAKRPPLQKKKSRRVLVLCNAGRLYIERKREEKNVFLLLLLLQVYLLVRARYSRYHNGDKEPSNAHHGTTIETLEARGA